MLLAGRPRPSHQYKSITARRGAHVKHQVLNRSLLVSYLPLVSCPAEQNIPKEPRTDAEPVSNTRRPKEVILRSSLNSTQTLTWLQVTYECDPSIRLISVSASNELWQQFYVLWGKENQIPGRISILFSLDMDVWEPCHLGSLHYDQCPTTVQMKTIWCSSLHVEDVINFFYQLNIREFGWVLSCS